MPDDYHLLTNQLPAEIKVLVEKLIKGKSFDFVTAALSIFEWQSEANDIYKRYLEQLNFVYPTKLEDIPCLPIQFFKQYPLKSLSFSPEVIFKSSGTSQQAKSRHLVASEQWYHEICTQIFTRHFSSPSDSIFLALLPHYINAGNSSLVNMVHHFMTLSNDKRSCFVENISDLSSNINAALNSGKDTFLFGVPYALLDFSIQVPSGKWENLYIIETGGMKGRRTEITKIQLHHELSELYQTTRVYSEYGMTELISQCYTQRSTRFSNSASLRIITKEINDPFAVQKSGKAGRINLIDLGNLHTICFIESDDLGITYGDNTFEIAGRLDNTDIRGCNLLYEEFNN